MTAQEIFNSNITFGILAAIAFGVWILVGDKLKRQDKEDDERKNKKS